ncbi:MAG TPA: SDR family NAD(P)-dependent oxidoreductase [Streptosporangiaceae bacterium]|nr:SDR family NAD(P)-dependent oxidoreductase [Streptosporangiaceae bacterium]
MTARWTSDDVPGQHGRVAVVTGANTGLGFEIARVLAARGASVVLAVRDTDKGKQAAARIAGAAPGATVTVQPLDLASLESVRAAAAELRARHPCPRCAPRPTPACSAASTTARADCSGPGATRNWPAPAGNPATRPSSAACGPSPKS